MPRWNGAANENRHHLHPRRHTGRGRYRPPRPARARVGWLRRGTDGAGREPLTVPNPGVHAIGEGGLLVFFGNAISAQINARAHEFARRLRESKCHGVTDIVPAYASVLVRFDPLIVAEEELRELIGSLAHELQARLAGQPGWSH